MAEIQLHFENLDRVAQAFKVAPDIAGEEIGRAVQRVAMQIERDAKVFAPVNKQSGGGNLRQSIRSFPTSKTSAMVEVGVKYAEAVHEGTRPHVITAKNKKVLADRRAGIIFGRSVRHPGTRPNPFLQKAVEKNEGWINAKLMEIANNIINRMF